MKGARFVWAFIGIIPMMLFAGCGSSDKAVVEDGAAAGTSRLFVANTMEDTISHFRIDRATGNPLPRKGVELAAESRPAGLAFHPYHKMLYIVNSNAGDGMGWNGLATVSAYRVKLTGALEEIEGSPFVPSSSPNSTLINPVVDPAGKFLYVADANDYSLVIFEIDATTGALTEIDSSPFALGEEPHGIAVSPSGEFLFVGFYGTKRISSYAIDPETGELTEAAGSPISTQGDNSNLWLAVTPNGKYLYGAGKKELIGFSIDGDTGELTDLPGFPHSEIIDLKSLAIHPSGKYLYAGDFLNDAVHALAIDDKDGAVTHLEQYDAGEKPKSVTVTPDGNYVYVANYGSDNVSGFSVDSATGELTSIGTYASGAGPKMILAP